MRKCSLCGKSFKGMGHNPMPLREYTERCCNDCNADVVIPLRMQLTVSHHRLLYVFGGDNKEDNND